MTGEAWLYLLAVLINAVNLFLQVFFTIMYSDLEWCVAPAACSRWGAYGMRQMACSFLLSGAQADHAAATTSIPSISATVSTPTSSLKLLYTPS